MARAWRKLARRPPPALSRLASGRRHAARVVRWVTPGLACTYNEIATSGDRVFLGGRSMAGSLRRRWSQVGVVVILVAVLSAVAGAQVSPNGAEFQVDTYTTNTQ